MGFVVVSRILGLIILAAGLLNGHDQLLLGLTASQFSLAHVLAMLLPLGEILFGSWLLVGLCPRTSWWLATGVFIAFLGASLDRGLAGASSCGCFGTFQIPPWYVVAVDCAALVLLWCNPPGVSVLSNPFKRLAALVLLVAISATVLSISTARTAGLDESGDFPDNATTITLQPETWAGKRLPLLKHIDVGSRLERGEWLVMLYHRTCPRCRELLPQYLGMAHQLAGDYDRAQAALIEIPPFEQEKAPESTNSSWLAGRLDGNRRWFGASPRFLRLKDGRVESSTDSFAEFMQNTSGGRVNSDSADGNLFPDYRKVRRDMFLREIACGPLALIAVLGDLGIPLSPDKIETLLAEAGSKGIDMLRLKELAEAHGLHGLGVMVSPSELRRMNQHAIVHMNNIGFAAEVGFVPGGVRVVYPLQPPGILPEQAFEKSFGQTGYALLLSRYPLRPEKLGLGPVEIEPVKGPHLLLSRRILPVGRVHRKDWETSITISNDGTETLRINKIEALCTCMSATVGKSELAPGETTELHAKGKEMLPGSFTAYVEVHTNEAENSVRKIPVRGYMEQPVGFSQPATLFEKILPDQRIELDIGLDVPPTVDPKELRIRISEEGPLQASIEPRGVGRHVLALRWLGEKKLGWYRFGVDVYTGTLEGSAIAPFHVAVQVVPTVDIFPPSVAISGHEWKSGWSRRIRCSFNRPFDGSWRVDWSDAKLSEQIQTTLESNANGLDLILKSSPGNRTAPAGAYTLRLISSDGSAHPLDLLLGEVRGLGEGAVVPKKPMLPRQESESNSFFVDRGQTKGHFRWFAAVGTAASALAVLLTSGGLSSAGHRGRVLSDGEMAAFFGDTPGPGAVVLNSLDVALCDILH